MRLLQATCDPNIELCEDSTAELVRASITPLVKLTFSWLGIAASPLVGMFIQFLTYDITSDEVIIWLLVVVGAGMLYATPFFASIIYMVFGSDFFLFNQVDEVLI